MARRSATKKAAKKKSVGYVRHCKGKLSAYQSPQDTERRPPKKDKER